MREITPVDPSDELEFWEVVLKFYEGRRFEYPVFASEDNNDEFFPLRNEKGELVPLFDENGEPARDEDGHIVPHLTVDGVLVRAATTEFITCRSNSSRWWPQISDKVAGGSVRMTVSKSVLGGDRIEVDPRMVRYLKWVDQNGVEPIFQGPDGERLYAPRFSIVQDVPQRNISWSGILRRARREKYLDDELRAGTNVTGVARDVLIRAAETDADLKEILSNPQLRKEATDALRKEITRQLVPPQKKSRNIRSSRNAENLQITRVR
jgi:hypothetical protein